MVERMHRFGRLVFDRDAIVRAALRAYVELGLVRLDPLKRNKFRPCFGGEWEGDFQRGAFYNDNAEGDYEVVAWNEAGVVGLAYELGFGPIEQLELSVDAVTGGPDDVRGAVPGLPADLESAFVMAVGTLYTAKMHHGEKLAGIGFWLHGDRVEGSFFEDQTAAGVERLAAWGLLHGDRLPLAQHTRVDKVRFEPEAAPIHAIIDAVTARALVGPTELTPDEFATLCPTPPNPQQLLHTQQALQKVGIALPALAASP